MPTPLEQIDLWRATKSDTDNLEFKEARNHFDFDRLLEYCVALANEGGGKLVLGIASRPPHHVLGTVAFPDSEKTAREILNRLKFQVAVEAVPHPDGRILLFHVPSRPLGQPLHIGWQYLIRRGQSLTRMTPAQVAQAYKEGKFGLKQKINIRWPNAYQLITIFGGVLLLVVGFASLYQWRQPPAIVPAAHLIARRAGSPASAPARADWHDKDNWRKSLRVGMATEEVLRFFGDPDNINQTQNFETWHYGFGTITFYEGKIYSWLPPD